MYNYIRQRQEKCPARAIDESPRVPEKTANPLPGHFVILSFIACKSQIKIP